jgi:hypothetical protein
MEQLNDIRHVLLPKASINNLVSTILILSVLWLSPQPFVMFSVWLFLLDGLFGNSMSKMHSCIVPYPKMYICGNHLTLLTLTDPIMCVNFIRPFMALSRPPGHGFSVLVLSFFVLALLKARLTILCLFIMITFLL